MELTYTFRAIIEPDEGGFHGYVPALPGCHTCGNTIEETKENLKDAISLFVASLLDDGKSIPQEELVEFYPTITTQDLLQIDPPPKILSNIYASTART